MLSGASSPALQAALDALGATDLGAALKAHGSDIPSAKVAVQAVLDAADDDDDADGTAPTPDEATSRRPRKGGAGAKGRQAPTAGIASGALRRSGVKLRTVPSPFGLTGAPLDHRSARGAGIRRYGRVSVLVGRRSDIPRRREVVGG